MTDQQLSLEDVFAPDAQHHATARDTEIAAAAAVRPKSGTQRMAVLAAVVIAGAEGLTDPEIAERTNLYLYSAAPRRVELLKAGWVEDSGQRRLTPNGRKAVVWVATDAGRVAWREAAAA